MTDLEWGEWVRPECETNSCVEVLEVTDWVRVRSSERPDLEVAFTRAEWRRFIDDVRAGGFDV